MNSNFKAVVTHSRRMTSALKIQPKNGKLISASACVQLLPEFGRGFGEFAPNA